MYALKKFDKLYKIKMRVFKKKHLFNDKYRVLFEKSTQAAINLVEI